MVAAGTVCVFHVGGCHEEASGGRDGDAVQRWEFFIGDRPHAPAASAAAGRQPMVQIAAADRIVKSGEMSANIRDPASMCSRLVADAWSKARHPPDG